MSMPTSSAFPAFATAARIRGRMSAPSARSTGLILVGIVHLLMVGALVKGFQRHAVEVPPPIEFKPIVDKPEPPRPVETLQVPMPAIPKPHLVEVPIPPVVITPTTEPVVVAVGISDGRTNEAFEVKGDGAKQVEAPVKQPPTTVVQQPGAICTQMGAPEMPTVNWSGEAVFRAMAEVQGGRVVAVQLQALSGSMDVRTRRAFSNAIEGTLKSRYVCPGEHRFQQDFAFRVD